MQPRVIFVGAGPVGLMAAIQTKLYNPDLPILMLEKYPEYKRNHLLHLEQSSFESTHSNPEFQKIIKSLSGRIRTNELESTLLAYAKKLGIIIEFTPVKDCKAFATKYPEAQAVVGADGSHSIVHEQIFNKEYQIKKTLKYIAEFKYEVEGKTSPLKLASEVIPALTYTKHLVSEYVGKEKKGVTPVSLRIFINEETYERMKTASFKNPFKLAEKEKIDPALYQTLDIWLKARATMAGEQRKPDSDRLTVTNLPVYVSKDFVKKQFGKIFYLVGDAAFGVPYFRALNNGILCSSRLAKALDAQLNDRFIEDDSVMSSISQAEMTPEQFYTRYVQSLVKKEDWVATIKNMGVTSLEYGAASSRSFPYVKRASLSLTENGRDFKESVEIRDTKISDSSFFKAQNGQEKENIEILPKKTYCVIL